MDQMPLPASWLDELFASHTLYPSGVRGVSGRGAAFERVIDGLSALINRLGADQQAEVVRFPPVMPRAQFERVGHFANFPTLSGSVHAFCGDERTHRRMIACQEAGEDWQAEHRATDVVLTPAACYPVYPLVASRGTLPDEGVTMDVMSWCFRNEPSNEPTRMLSFRMREYVRIGTPAQVMAFRSEWLERGRAMGDSLGLPLEIEVANDPFFGRAGTLLADSQRAQELKFELLVQVNDGAGPTACTSFNYHLDHFGQVWDMRTADGAPAHTGCIGFGLERLTLALLRHHGLDLALWPASVRQTLWPTSSPA